MERSREWQPIGPIVVFFCYLQSYVSKPKELSQTPRNFFSSASIEAYLHNQDITTLLRGLACSAPPCPPSCGLHGPVWLYIPNETSKQAKDQNQLDGMREETKVAQLCGAVSQRKQQPSAGRHHGTTRPAPAGRRDWGGRGLEESCCLWIQFFFRMVVWNINVYGKQF